MNAVVAIVALLVGAIAGLLLALTRWQAVHLLSAVWYYRLLTAHGLNMLIFFIIFFEMAVLYFAGPIVLGSRVPAPKLGWLSFVLMVAGALLVEVMVFTGKADVLFTSYPPLRADPLYYLGIILFAVGALIVSFLFMATLVVAKREKTYEGSIPLVTFGGLTAAIIAIITLLHGAIIYIPTLAWSMNYMNMDPEIYRHDLLGPRPQLAADQRGRAGFDLVPARRPHRRRGGRQREDQPHGVRAVHRLHLDGLGPPPAGRPRLRPGVEGLEHQLRDVPRGARQHGARLHGAGRHRDRPAAARLRQRHVRVAAQGAVERPGLLRACGCRW